MRKYYIQPNIRVRQLMAEDSLCDGFGFNTGSTQTPDPDTPHLSKDGSFSVEDSESNDVQPSVWE